MQRILYYIFIYNILFEGVFEGRKQPPTSPIRQSWRIQKGKCRTKGIVRGDSPEKWTDAEGERGKERSVNVRRSLRTKDLHPIAANGAHKASMNSRIVPP